MTKLCGAELAAFKEKIRAMRDRGITLHRIAQMTSKHHSTILYHLNDDFSMLKRAKMRKRFEIAKRIKDMQARRNDAEIMENFLIAAEWERMNG